PLGAPLVERAGDSGRAGGHNGASLRRSCGTGSQPVRRRRRPRRGRGRVENPSHIHSRGNDGEYSTAFMNSGSVPRQKRRKCGSSANVITCPFPYGSLTKYAEPFSRSIDSFHATPATSGLSLAMVTTLSTRCETGSSTDVPSISTNGLRGSPKVRYERSLIAVRNVAPGTRRSL